MNEFNREDLMFYLPDEFKGLTKKYMLDCIFDETIQNNWEPNIGDIMVGCTGNIFPISGKHNLIEKLGGTVFFFGGSLCSRDGGGFMNSTQTYLMNKNGIKFGDAEVSPFKDFRYIPYPHERERSV